MLCEEPRPAYDRVHLSEFFSGKSADDLSLVAPGFFDKGNVLLKLNARAVVDRPRGENRHGQHAAKCWPTTSWCSPPARTRSCRRCRARSARTASSTAPSKTWKRCCECGSTSKTGVVIGGGLLGLECAKALRDMKLETHVVEFAPRLMAVQVDDGGARVLRRKIEELGVTVHTQKNTLDIVDGEAGTHRMRSPTAATWTPT